MSGQSQQFQVQMLKRIKGGKNPKKTSSINYFEKTEMKKFN